jgi:hydroxypyruvate isomerase
MRFNANISILFKDIPFLERFHKAAEAGFGAVEFWWPTGEDIQEVEAAAKDAALDVVLFNFNAGNMAVGDRGLLSDPVREGQFRENVPVALELAAHLGVQRLNALVGCHLPGFDYDEQIELARKNVAWSADQAKKVGAEILIEAVNTFENGPYLLSHTEQALQFIQTVDRENVKFQYDVYHMQRMEGNIVATLRKHIKEIAHIQIADSPGRGEPGTGEINYHYVLNAIEDLGYNGYMGLEYNPTNANTIESLKWLPQAARRGNVKVADLRL